MGFDRESETAAARRDRTKVVFYVTLELKSDAKDQFGNVCPRMLYVTDREVVHKINLDHGLAWMNHSPFETALRAAIRKFTASGYSRQSYNLTMFGGWFDFEITEVA